MKKKFSQHIKRGLPGGANQLNKFTKGVVSTEGYRSNSPDKDNSVNVINSSSITMTESDGEPLKKGPLFGMDNLGNKQLMMPGFNYQFPGSQVAEMPMTEEGMIVELSEEEIEEYQKEGYIVENVSGPRAEQLPVDHEAMNAMMKARLAYEQMHGNPAATRMVAPTDNPYIFPSGAKGTHFMSSYDNYAIPEIQSVNGVLKMTGPRNKEAIRFDRPEDADYFAAENYKRISPAFKREGGYMDIEASEEEIEMYKRGGYIIEELPNKKGECIGCLDKKQKGDAGMPECPEGAKYDFKRKSCVCSGKTRWDGTQCVQDVAETTVYKKQESRRKQLKLMDRLKLLKQAYKQFHNKGGFGNLTLDVDDKTDKIPKLKQLVQLYEKELKDVEKQHAPAFTALKQLKENNPEKYKNFKLNDIYDPQTFEDLRGLYAEGKLGDDSGQNDMLFRYFNNTLGKGVDLNIAEGTGPNASYSAKDTEDNWMHDAQGFTDMVSKFAVAAPLVGASAALAGPAAGLTSRVLSNPWVQRGLTGYGLLQAPRHAKGAYDAYQKDDWTGVAKNTALLGTDLIPALKFKNVLPTAKGTANLVKNATLKELASGTKYLGKFNPLRLKTGYNPKAINFSNPLLQKYVAPNINNLRAVGAGPATGNVITGGKDLLGAGYRLGKATSIPVGAYELSQMGSKGAENITHADMDRAGSRILDIYNPLPQISFLQKYSNNPLAKYAIREGKDVLKAGFDFDAENWGKGATRLIGTALGNKSAGQYTTKLFGNKLQDVTEQYALPAVKNLFTIPGIDSPFQNLPVIRTDSDGRLIDSDTQTTEQVDVAKPKQIIIADNYRDKTYQMKRSKAKSKTLKQGGVIETLLTQKEIDMFRKGGYIVEEL